MARLTATGDREITASTSFSWNPRRGPSETSHDERPAGEVSVRVPMGS